MNTFLLTSHVLMVICGICKGTFFPVNGYTLTGVASDTDGGCPQECVGEASGIRGCDCMGTSREGTITGVLIDGVIPTIDTSQRGNWASQLFTIQASMPSYALGFRLHSRVKLQEVELYVLYCPDWQIGANTINVYDSTAYPTFNRAAPSVGSVNLTSNMQNCESLTRVSIPLQRALRVSSYFIEFTNPKPIHRLYIAEVRFSDQPISTSSTATYDPTDPVIEPSNSDTITRISETTINPTPTHPQSSQESTMDTTHSIHSTMNTTHITITAHFTPSTPNTTNTPVPIPNTTSPLTITTIILVVVIAVLVLVVVGMSVSFIAVVYAVKTKSPGGVINEGTDYDCIEELDRSCEVIETKRNEAYIHVSGRRSVGVKMVRNEECATCIITTDGVHVNDAMYEEVRI